MKTADHVSQSRHVERLVAGRETSDGAGVRLTRVLTQDLQRRLDPFLMLDAFGSDDPEDYIAGFPDHPHRGFETVTYMLAGRMAILANEGDGVSIEAPEDARLVLVAARPLGEPIVQYGPFVMNTQQEIQQAFADYRDGRLA